MKISMKNAGTVTSLCSFSSLTYDKKEEQIPEQRLLLKIYPKFQIVYNW